MTPNRNTLAEQLRRAIQEAPMNQNTLAYRSGVSAGVISRFRRNQRDIGIDVAGRLAAALGLALRPIRRARKRR